MELFNLIISETKSIIEILAMATAPITLLFTYLNGKRSKKNTKKIQEVGDTTQQIKININGRMDSLIEAKVAAAYAKGIEDAHKAIVFSTEKAAANVLATAAKEAATTLAAAAVVASDKIKE